jgi:hypothetical protein
MKRFLPVLIFATMIAAPACAQERTKIEVTGAELQVIGQALGKMPFEVAAPVIKVLQDQINAADAAKAAPPAKPPEPAKTPEAVKK